jgi:hypothetical protein
MLRRALPALLLVPTLALACTSTNNPGNAEQPEQVAADGSNGEGEVAPQTDGSADGPNVLGSALELADCPAEGDAHNMLVTYCNAAGKLVGSWSPVDLVRVPDEVEILFHAEHPDSKAQTSLLVCVHGEQLYIRHVTCGACRRVVGQGFAGVLAQMSAEQLRAMQKQLGLGEDLPALDSVARWREFAGDEQGKAVLIEISKRGSDSPGGER